MGVRGLWRILEPVKQHKSLADLRGQVIAVDLSIWIVEAKSVLPPSVTKPHLRNLIFRVLHLLQLGIVPVIVVEGVPPDLKQGVMRKRLKHQYRNGPSGELPKKIGRTRFQAVHRECCEVLEMLGVPFVQAASEAEAMCAFLNRLRVVDGCITNDGDAFLYGARTVYRNFTMNAKDRHVDMYSMDDVETTLGLNRESLVGLAVLLGCDYLPKGVAGVGQEMALRFISYLSGESLLQRFNLWKTGGIGSGKGLVSVTEKPVEENICRRALASHGFPYKEVVDEFLVDKDKVPQEQRLIWKRPKLFKIVNYAVDRLEWPEEYTLSKILPLLTLFDMDALICSGIPSSQSLCPYSLSEEDGHSSRGIRFNSITFTSTSCQLLRKFAGTHLNVCIQILDHSDQSRQVCLRKTDPQNRSFIVAMQGNLEQKTEEIQVSRFITRDTYG